MKALIFNNFSDKEFIGKYGGVPYIIPAKAKMMFEDWLANHFAKHFADQVMNERDIRTNDMTARKMILEKCLIDPAIEADSAMQLNVAMANQGLESSTEQVVPEVKEKGKGKKAPVRKGADDKKSNPIGSSVEDDVIADEEEFEGLSK